MRISTPVSIGIGLIALLMLTQCQREGNPLLVPFNTPHSIPPFDRIRVEHFEPAILEAMALQREEIEAIASNPQAPTFENTILPLEYSGLLLNSVATIFFNLSSAHTSPELQALSQAIGPMLSAHSDDITLNAELFRRVQAVHSVRESLGLSQEEAELLERTYRGFVRGGANLPEAQRARFREINEQLSRLSLQFADNVLAETNAFRLVIEDSQALAGLPEGVVAAAAQAAAEAGLEGQWLFTLHNPSLIPFLQHSNRRELRERMQRAHSMRGNNDNQHDNKGIVEQMVNLRIERAQLLGYPTHAHYILEENMAGNPETVMQFLRSLWAPTLTKLRAEAADLQTMVESQGDTFRLAPWDWWYYTERLRRERFDLDEGMLRPYFSLETVKAGIFDLTHRLYGLRYERLHGVPTYHPEVEVYRVMEADGRHLGILMMDFHPRESKRGGAWMTSFRRQYVTPDGEHVPPIISIVCNFTRPTQGQPALLTPDEVLTFFHEFGHALHGLLSRCTFPSLSGTSVPKDFVELPAQIMENWSMDPLFLRTWARHYQTGEPIPEELIDRIKASQTFNQGFITGEYLASAFIDMDYHLLTQPTDFEVNAFEAESMARIGLIPAIKPRHRSTHFQHIFTWGYSSGYYSYIWSGVLDADAYEAFRETGDLFHPEVAQRFRTLMERGGTVRPMDLYIQFRGAEPSPTPLLRKRGLI